MNISIQYQLVCFISLTHFLPLFMLQETGNVPYVEKGGFGFYSGNNPKRISSLVYKLFTDNDLMQQMSIRAKTSSNPFATRNIARDIGDLVLAG